MVARFAGVTCTVTTGSFSFSSLLQPANRKNVEAAAIKAAGNAVFCGDAKRNFNSVRFFVLFMELSTLPSKFANSPEPRGNAPLRPGRRRWIARRSFARQPLRARWLRRLCSEAWSVADFLPLVAQNGRGRPIRSG